MLQNIETGQYIFFSLALHEGEPFWLRYSGRVEAGGCGVHPVYPDL